MMKREISHVRQNNCNRITEPSERVSGQSSGSFRGGYLSSDQSHRLQRPAESACGIYDPYNKALYKVICPTLLASDYRHNKCVIERQNDFE